MYELKLYVVGRTPKSVKVIDKLVQLLEDTLDGHYHLEVIDVVEKPELAKEDKILATPALVKALPPPVRKVIGDLSDREKVLLGLGLTTG